MDCLLYNPFSKWIICYITIFKMDCLLYNPFSKWIITPPAVGEAEF